ncbi:MAG: hypothetical protein ACOX0T_02765 [Pelotomaculum sp.]
MKNRNNQKLEAITPKTLIIGVDIAKQTQWARFVNYRGLEIGKALKFQNDRKRLRNYISKHRCNLQEQKT